MMYELIKLRAVSYTHLTQVIDKFEVLDKETLLRVEGGGWLKCGLGTVGGALTGGVAGAAVGTVTLPIIGTVSGLSLIHI